MVMYLWQCFLPMTECKIKIENGVVSEYVGFSLNPNGRTTLELAEEINMAENQPKASSSKEL